MRRLYTDLDVINVVVLRHKGVSYRDIARKCGLSPGTVQKILEKYSEIILPDLIPLLTKINQICSPGNHRTLILQKIRLPACRIFKKRF